MTMIHSVDSRLNVGVGYVPYTIYGLYQSQASHLEWYHFISYKVIKSIQSLYNINCTILILDCVYDYLGNYTERPQSLFILKKYGPLNSVKYWLCM